MSLAAREAGKMGARVTIIALDQPATAFLLGLKTAILNNNGLLLARRERGSDVRLTAMVSATRPWQELGNSSQWLTNIVVKATPERRPLHCPAFPSQLMCHWSFLFCTDSRPLCLSCENSVDTSWAGIQPALQTPLTGRQTQSGHQHSAISSGSWGRWRGS